MGVNWKMLYVKSFFDRFKKRSSKLREEKASYSFSIDCCYLEFRDIPSYNVSSSSSRLESNGKKVKESSIVSVVVIENSFTKEGRGALGGI